MCDSNEGINKLPYEVVEKAAPISILTLFSSCKSAIHKTHLKAALNDVHSCGSISTRRVIKCILSEFCCLQVGFVYPCTLGRPGSKTNRALLEFQPTYPRTSTSAIMPIKITRK
ncbi:uncharacterized protein LOC125468720 isoform X2 [Pyrus x bretschneideri]|uniref:uncharacterized protein LOC125468720 isoform X2 n=1 Tax=Pyrus x bretschneideri TaxID=225117 RepID=UPI00202F8157|nr:uncharacterized protein LOC125468720 isoform X2 [Pyrus x bretschneideri]